MKRYIYDNVFLHYRAGGNWRKEGLELHKLLSQKLKNDEYSRMLKTSLMENTTISNNLEISKINHPQINNVMDQSKLNLNSKNF